MDIIGARGRSYFILALLGFLGACQQSPYSEVVDLSSNFGTQPAAATGSVQSAFLAPAGNFGMVTMRGRPDIPGTTTQPMVICTAPSPDWATAYAMAQQIEAQGGDTGGTSASLSASRSATETITAMAGRTAGVVALRDGLYKACEAYANGVIGKDAYALILSQYGNLLVSLAGSGASGTGASGSGSTPASASTPPGVAVAVTTGGTTTAATPKSGDTSQGQSTTPPLLQQQVLQALLVACISEYDPTVSRSGTTGNTLLADPQVCSPLLRNIVQQVPVLFGAKPATPPAKPVATPRRVVRPVVAAPTAAPGARAPVTPPVHPN